MRAGSAVILTYAKYQNQARSFSQNQQVIPRNNVTQQFQQTLFLREQSIESRGWTLDVMKCVDKLPERFTLAQVYSFSDVLQSIYINNNNVHAKIRQQLQILRDKGMIEFLGRGNYRKLN